MNESEMQKEAFRAKRQNIVIFGIFTAVFVLLLTGVCVYRYQHSYSRHKWDLNPENRYKLVGDLLEKNPLAGMTEAEVLALLGAEDGGERTSFKISKTYFPPESTLVYWLGVDFMDDNWLVISLDGGKVTDYRIDLT